MISVMHDSRSPFYKKPFGARPVGSKACFAIDFRGENPQKVFLRTWNSGEHIFEMTQEPENAGKFTYSTTIDMPECPCLFWYYFIIELNGRTLYYGNNPEKLGGRGKLYDHEPPGYQITVYKASKMPEWLYGGLIYQIFPDRFFNPYEKPLALKRDSLWHDDWYRDPLYARDRQTGEILSYDFFGGNLDGITAKLDYLEDFGVTLIYLNPIFLSVSNHRFDTGDYEKIDPVLGDIAAFSRLCHEAEKRGIHVMLDGVFSHTGSDSKYFNKEGTFEEIGAYQSKESCYYNWFQFTKYPEEYESWWGIGNLPNVNELDPDYLYYMIEAKRSIAARWLQAGAKGWRLDVADELPEEFIRMLRWRIKHEDSQSLLLGEVWEDASNKNAYGTTRCYFLGDQLDSVMNYPFKTSVFDFLLGKKTSRQVIQELFSLYENYPAENFDLLMNLLGTHDTPRLLTELAGVDGSNLNDAKKRKFRLNYQQRLTAFRRLWLAVVWQMTFCGLPSVYYGDEAGMQGFADPFNRGTYPWNREDETAYKFYWRLARIRRRYDVLRFGSWRPLLSEPDIVGYGRYHEGDSSVVVLNRSEQRKSFSTSSKKALADILSGDVFVPEEGRITLPMENGQARILQNKVQYPDRLRKAGILLHPTSLPSEYGIGDFGPECHKFVDFLKESGHLLWQILPLTPADYVGSPYAGDSAFAGNTLLISPKLLAQKGYVTEKDLHFCKADDVESGKVDFVKVKNRKAVLFKQAYKNFKPDADFEKFCQKNAFWLCDYALFCSLKEHFNGVPWREWPKPLVDRKPEELLIWTDRLADKINYHSFLQYEFWLQWSAVRKAANEKGIVIIGDVPLYLSHDSADVWTHQEIFDLDENKNPKGVAGVPPDYFSKTGQLWGNPLYNWEACKCETYDWWKKRLEQSLNVANILRLDHFRAFESYWRVPYGRETAAFGNWETGPGIDFFLTIQKHFKDLPFIVEDLGVITSAVNLLRDRFALPGMDILQFGLSGDTTKILYTGTHDNDTLCGFIQKHKDYGVIASLSELAGIPSMVSEEQTADMLMKFVYTSDYTWVITPLQDLLGLDSKARMNTPSTLQGNWSWRLSPQALDEKILAKAKELVKLGARGPVKNIDEIIHGM